MECRGSIEAGGGGRVWGRCGGGRLVALPDEVGGVRVGRLQVPGHHPARLGPLPAEIIHINRYQMISYQSTLKVILYHTA